jgi:hypothetical protein
VDRVQFPFQSIIEKASVHDNILCVLLKEELLVIDLVENTINSNQKVVNYFYFTHNLLLIYKDQYEYQGIKTKNRLAADNILEFGDLLLYSLKNELFLIDSKRRERKLVCEIHGNIQGMIKVESDTLLVFVSTTKGLFKYRFANQTMIELDTHMLENTGPGCLLFDSGSLVWLLDHGIYTGVIKGKQFLQDIRIIPFPKDTAEVIGIQSTEYHYLIQTTTNIKVMNKLDNDIIYTLDFELSIDEYVVDIYKDITKNTLWFATSQNLYEIIVTDELNDIYKIYLDRENFKEALKVCGNQKGIVSTKYANHLFERRQYKER